MNRFEKLLAACVLAGLLGGCATHADDSSRLLASASDDPIPLAVMNTLGTQSKRSGSATRTASARMRATPPRSGSC